MKILVANPNTSADVIDRLVGLALVLANLIAHRDS